MSRCSGVALAPDRVTEYSFRRIWGVEAGQIFCAAIAAAFALARALVEAVAAPAGGATRRVCIPPIYSETYVILFWLIVSAMVLVGLAFVVPPLLGRYTRAKSVSMRLANVDIHRERLRELEAQKQEGTLSADDHAQALLELDRNLLEDTQDGPTKEERQFSRARAAVSVVVAVALIPVLSLVLYEQYGTSRAITYVPDPAVAAAGRAQAGAQEVPSVEDMVAGLEKKRLAGTVEAGDLQLLARSYVELRRFKDAIALYDEIISASDAPTPALLIDYAQAESLGNSYRFSDKALERLESALKAQPNNPKGLWLGGMAAMQRNDVNAALKRWDSLLAALPAESQQAQVVRTLIERTRGGGGAQAAQPAAQNEADPHDQQAQGQAQAKIVVDVSIAPELAAGLSGGETVFVFARAASGPRMPAAIVRVPVSELPTQIELTDAQSVMPTAKLSTLDSVVVGARVSLSGDAMPKSGDLQGLTQALPVSSTERTKVVIDERVP